MCQSQATHRRVAIIDARVGVVTHQSTAGDVCGLAPALMKEACGNILLRKHSCTGNTVERETLLRWKHTRAGRR